MAREARDDVSTPRVLLVARNYPPIRGGMEQYCFDLYQNLSRVLDLDLLANRHGHRGIPLFGLRVAAHLLRHRRRYTHVHLGDAALALFVPLVRWSSAARVSVTAHGLDVVFPHPLYQRFIPRWLGAADAVVCVSHATRQECLARGVLAARCHVIPNGIDLRRPGAPPTELRVLESRHGFELGDRRLLFSIARLIPRKGHVWFVSKVLPALPESFVYCVAGEGPEREGIRRAAGEAGVAERVLLPGAVSDEDKAGFLEVADRFVMPNRRVPGDLEGFGISLIEAACHGLASVAAAIDGIPDAVVEGETGRLVPEGDVESFAAALRAPAPDRSAVRAAARRHFAWEGLAERYAALVRGG